MIKEVLCEQAFVTLPTMCQSPSNTYCSTTLPSSPSNTPSAFLAQGLPILIPFLWNTSHFLTAFLLLIFYVSAEILLLQRGNPSPQAKSVFYAHSMSVPPSLYLERIE